ncbi:hypothetical protein [Bacillus thuringiensis]|uniref:Restriction endonuclease n=1 Tax=Bacillus thuringiensis subsp. darmstadiensis TaxID=132264 RepID=A0A9X6G3Y9_BACUD|nr:hypothetical protein [Bacillus thuringiensis]ADH09507.1 hypothetical protein BMB171_C4699 [Bacillus thuringiensis BMB171]OTZ33782.1 hypothetical protein BK761_12475 [Bacillus thuringiensis serovar darmstadiensis]HDR6291190.1 hypothetical protein [Bacillus cereus]
MSIFNLWQNNKKVFEEKNVEQILTFCGDGKLYDGNATSLEFRELLNNVPLRYLQKYSEDCLSSSFTNSGFVLQDLINQIGIRLGYKCEYGLYRGRKNQIGFDGIWNTKDGYQFLVEVKTTDTYRINLDTLATYRRKLIEQNRLIENKSSILIVVGRQDTGDLEAQIRGSKHAWDVRLISTDALIKLMTVRANLNDTKTFQQINEILRPLEYTRIDQLINIIFHTAEDLQLENDVNDEINSSQENDHPKSNKDEMNDLCIEKISKKLKVSLIKQGRCIYSSPDNNYHVVCIVSKSYKRKNLLRYWYAFRTAQKEFLEETEQSYIAFGCGSDESILLIPYSIFESYLNFFSKTEKGNRYYWHVEAYQKNNTFEIRRNDDINAEVTKYLI